MSLPMVIQGYFPPNALRQLAQLQPSAIQPYAVKGPALHAWTYEELTAKAHQHSASPVVQRSSAGSNIFVLPQHLASFSRRPGQSLPYAIQRQMGSFLKADFSDVQVHVGPE